MAGKTHEIAFKIAGQMAGSFSSSFKNAGKAISSLQAATGSLLRTASNTGGLKKQVEATEKSRQAYVAATNQLRELANAMLKTKQPTDAQKAAFVELEKKVQAAKNSFEQNKQKLNELRNATGISETSIEKLNAAFEKQKKTADLAKNALAEYNRVQEKIAGVNSKIDGLKSGMASNVGNIAGVVGAAAATVGLPIKEAMSYEDAMADVTKVVSFTGEEMKTFKASVDKMGQEIALSAPDLLNIAAAWGATGKEAHELEAYTKLTAQSAVAMGMSAEDAGEMMAKWAGGMGLTYAQTKELANITNELSNNMSAAAPQIGDFLMRVGSSGGLKGMDPANMAAFGAALLNAGNTAETAATGAREFLSVLGAKTWSDKQAKAFEELGLGTNEEMNLALVADAPGTIQKILDSIAKLRAQGEEGEGKANALMDAAFGTTAGEAIAKLVKDTTGYSKALETLGDKQKIASSLEKEFAARNATTSNALVLVGNAFSAVMRAIGDPLLEPIRAFSNSIVAMTPAITEFVKENQNLIMKVLKVAAIFGTVVIAANGLMLVLRAIALPVMYAYKSFLTLKSAFLAVKAAALKMNLTFLASPWFWIIAAVVALVAAGVLLYKNFDTVRLKVNELWAAFSAKFPGIAALLQYVFESVKQGLLHFWTYIKTVFLMIVEVGKAAFTGLSAVFMNVLGLFDNLIRFVMNVFTGNWSDAWENVKNIFKNIFDGVLNIFITCINTITSAFNGLIKGLNGIKIPDWVPVVGGKKLNIPTIPQIPQLAKGGIATESTLANIGEAGPEAVIPLRKLENMVGGGFTFAPTINVSGGGGNVYSDIKKALNESKADLRREMDRYFADKRRLSYA